MADNRRVRMTKKLIKDAYLELLEKHPSERISVTDICKTADVNRSTFYMYYEDTIRLRQDIENDVLAQIPVLTDGSVLALAVSCSFSIFVSASARSFAFW